MKKKTATIHDIALSLNISSSTVSRALSNHPGISKPTVKKVLLAAKKLNYRPNILASNLRKGHGNTIGVVIPAINRHFFSGAIAGIEAVACANGYNVLIAQTQESYQREIQSIETLINARVDGVIISLTAQTENYAHIETLMGRDIPLVMFDRVCDGLEVSKVVLDDVAVGHMVSSYLLQQGRRKIVHLSGTKHINVYNNRQLGYERALAEHGMAPNPHWVVNDCITRENGYAYAIDCIKTNNLPDAVFAASDFSALGALLAFKENGIHIPQDIAIAGVANEPFTSLMCPAITSVEQFSERMGKTAANLLFDQLSAEGPFEPTKILIEPKLYIRESTEIIP
ncbi:MAG: LacI family transcriptional regulator [Bacteroidales bacterium]|nr:LacI family transcriptional regulator [Bacteroidales bacterium]